jgi:hypothetical protein
MMDRSAGVSPTSARESRASAQVVSNVLPLACNTALPELITAKLTKIYIKLNDITNEHEILITFKLVSDVHVLQIGDYIAIRTQFVGPPYTIGTMGFLLIRLGPGLLLSDYNQVFSAVAVVWR